MKTIDTTKEALLGLAVTAISGGMALAPTDIKTGIVLIVTGFGLVLLRGWLKIK